MDTQTIERTTTDSFNKPKKAIKGLKPEILNRKSNYDNLIPRKVVEKLCGTSRTFLTKMENEGLLNLHLVKHGRMEIAYYSASQIHKIFKAKGQTFKNKKDAEIISVFSQKGGVGKSAVTQHLGSMLSLVGKVLIVDIDAQSDATVLFDVDPSFGDDLAEDSQILPTIQELMDWSLSIDEEAEYEKKEPNEVIKKISDTLHVLPSDLDLGEINYSLNRYPLKARKDENGNNIAPQLVMIKEVFDKIKNHYDYILVDCPPNIETCNVSALFASNRVVVPLELEAKSLTTMRRNIVFLEKLAELHSGFNWDRILVVPNKFRRETIKMKAYAALQDKYKNQDTFELSQVVLPNSTIIDKCSDWKQPIYGATSRYGTSDKSAIPQAKEFTNYFWAIMHEILDLDLDRLIFESGENEG